MRRIQRENGMFDDQVIRREFNLVVGTETEVVVLSLRGSVDPTALVSIERTLLTVAGDNVLPQLWSDGFEQIPEMTEDREVPKDGMLALYQIIDDDCQDDCENCGQY